MVGRIFKFLRPKPTLMGSAAFRDITARIERARQRHAPVKALEAERTRLVHAALAAGVRR